MTRPDKTFSDFALVQLIPNMLTIAAICAGMSAIRFGVQGNYELSTQLILAACILDGLDGRIARLLNSDSKMGAELDSLADFVNFGVAPPLVIYFWALQDMRSAAWISVLVFTICCVLRLARFNVGSKTEGNDTQSAYFVGVPSPLGALLVMLPMFVSFAIAEAPVVSGTIICFYMVFVGLAMISEIPTWSFKTTRISRANAKYFLVIFVIIGAAVLTYTWITLAAMCVGYIGMIIYCLFAKAPIKTDKGE